MCAGVLVKDEADVIEPLLRHLCWHVDEVLVMDNASSDGTREQLQELRDTSGLPIHLYDDAEVGYYQSARTTRLAREALVLGHRWFVPCDADELWYAPEGRAVRDWLAGLGREHQFVKAAIYNHVCTGDDDAEDGNPFTRIRWRQRAHLDLQWGKVACRTRPDLHIAQGNHSASTSGTGSTGYGLEIRHFPYRSAEHFVRKAVNGAKAYAATNMDEGIGKHWRVYGRAIADGGVEAGHKWFYDAFHAERPEADDSLVYDPAPLRGQAPA